MFWLLTPGGLNIAWITKNGLHKLQLSARGVYLSIAYRPFRFIILILQFFYFLFAVRGSPPR